MLFSKGFCDGDFAVAKLPEQNKNGTQKFCKVVVQINLKLIEKFEILYSSVV